MSNVTPLTMTAKNAAAHFGLPYKYVLSLIHDGEIEFFRVGKSYYVCLESLQKMARCGNSK